jgi:hypothetical protein
MIAAIRPHLRLSHQRGEINAVQLCHSLQRPLTIRTSLKVSGRWARPRSHSVPATNSAWSRSEPSYLAAALSSTRAMPSETLEAANRAQTPSEPSQSTVRAAQSLTTSAGSSECGASGSSPVLWSGSTAQPECCPAPQYLKP